MLQEIWNKKEDYMYTAKLSNNDIIIALEDGTAKGLSGNLYIIQSHLDDNDEVVVDGWEIAE